ncbi:hypothetical protein GGI04_002112 [Coemansia thaxteri]|nr:hypothetical protein GGI04_002112 [Coemansia thaxteri]
MSPASSRESSAEAPGGPEAQAATSTGRGSGSVRYLRACDNCRRRKVKCDGVRPSCGHCNRVEVPCHYSIKPKSRRMWKCLESSESASTAGPVASGRMSSGSLVQPADKSQADDTTARLLARVETMERLLMQRNGMSSPRVPSVTASMADDILSAQHGASTAAVMAGTMGSSAAGSAGLRQAGAGPASNSGSMGGLLLADLGAHAQGGNNGGGASMIPAKRDNERTSADPSYPPPLASMLTPPLPGADGSLGLHAPGAPSLEVVKHLIDTLFSNSNYMVEMLHEETFRRQFAAGTLSPLLLYSALASAARYSKHPLVRTDPPYNASAPFISRAKVLVVDAIEEPSLGNAQGLMLMCLMHFALGNETVTTFYKAMALNMCILLGYNRLDSVDGPVQPSANCCHDSNVVSSTMSLDWVDREAARRMWWTMFSIENYSSVCMGLTPSIQAEYCDVNLPASTLEWKQGRPGGGSGSGLAEANPAKRSRLGDNPVHLLAAYHAQLSLIFSKVAWLVTRTNASTEDAVAQFSELNSVLTRWYEGLPKELRLSSVETLLFGHQEFGEYYNICVLHMRFYTTVIQLNHAIPEFTDDPAVIEPGQRKCVIAASRISDLLRSSFEIPTELRDMNWYMCVFRAAHIHIYRLLSRDAESIARAKQDLAIHRRHLRDGGPLWRICNKLLSRLDDMEQMVMLLPAQIPVADLVRLKNLTRKGKSQLVNMQLDALIKPSLIRAENADSDDLPLMTRVEMTGSSIQQQAVSTSSCPTAGLCGGGLLDQQQRQLCNSNGSPTSTAVDGSSSGGLSQFSSMGSMGTLHGSMDKFSAAVSAGGGGGSSMSNGFASSSSSPSLIMPPLDHPGSGKLTQLHHASSSILSGPLLPPPAGVAPINTNIVIDNNMAETLVNYFYMVASNQSQQVPQPQGSTGNGGGTANPLASPGMPMMSSARLGSIGSGSRATILPSLPSMMPALSTPQQQQQQQQHVLFGHMYDSSGMPSGLVDNNGSFV